MGTGEREIVTINFPLMGVQHRNEVVREDRGRMSRAIALTRGNELTTHCVTDINDVTRELTTPRCLPGASAFSGNSSGDLENSLSVFPTFLACRKVKKKRRFSMD